MSSLDTMLRALSPVKEYSPEVGGEVYSELCAYAKELDEIDRIADELIRECFIATATDYGLAVYEKLNGPEKTDVTTATRREQLITSININRNDNTVQSVYKYLGALGLDCEITENTIAGDIYILAKGEYTREQRDYIIAMAEKFLPCHHTFTIDFRTDDWAALDAKNLTFKQLDEKELTWQQIEGN